jgi:hypothetical protein
VTAVVIALEIGRRRFAAQITIDALFIDIGFPWHIFRVFVGNVRHNRPFILRER